MNAYKTAGQHIRRSPYQALAAILIMTLTFFVLSSFAFLVSGSSIVIQYFESKPQVTAFFKDEAQQEEIDTLIESLDANDKVANVRFVSKSEALKIYQEQNKEDPLLLELVTEEILPSSVEIATVNIDDLGEISDSVKNSPIVSEVIYQKDIVSTLGAWTDAIRKIGMVLIVLLSMVSIFIMATIIGFKISQKREEIEIMKLLSATNWYVRWPFILEGIFYGLVGAFFGWLIASAGLLYATPFLQSFLQGIPLFPISPYFFLGLLGIEFIIAIILGFFSSFLAVLRYLK